MIALPEEFRARMSRLLGDGQNAFFAAMEEENAVRGVRVNTLKASPDRVLPLFSSPLQKLPYGENCFRAEDALEGIGRSPMHHAGMIYLQDPGAMSTLCALDLPKGARVIDLCSAPGGKSSQIAERIGEEGFLLSNEFVPKRAKITVANFERLGIRNAFVTSADTAVFQSWFSAYFDLVLADVPCSGEGMFRKSEEALADWSPENVRLCAKRQEEILENAAPLVASGGKLLYSTCTFSLEENEMQVDTFLKRHPDFHLIEVKEAVRAATKEGIVYDKAASPELVKCRRFYPHISPGEGQFVALLERDNTGELPTILYKSAEKPLPKEEKFIVDAFLRETLAEVPEGRILRAGESIVLVRHAVPLPPRSLFSAGVLLGEVRGKNFFPAHQFFSAYGAYFRRKVSLSCEEAYRYLAGEELPASENAGSGFCAVFYEGAALGGGKLSDGRLKNHYPKGLRNVGALPAHPAPDGGELPPL